MPENPIFLLGLSIFLSAIPIAVWLYIISKKEQKGRKTLLAVFGIGCLTAPALLGLQYFWDEYENFNLQLLIENTFKIPVLTTILIILLFVVMEETIKLFVVKTVDKKTLYISRINDAMLFSIATALGFSFIENAYYLYSFWGFISTGEVIGMYIFRSLFTTSAHMLYTGVSGYFYGVGKFAMVINEHREIMGEEDKLGKWIAKIFKLPLSEGFRQKAVMKGYLFAIAMHFSVNFLLEYQMTIPVIFINIGGFLFLQYLLKRKAGHLILLSDPTTRKPSTIATKDKDVVVELLGMWFKEKKFVDVLHVCERLLERDPDNKVVKLFKAKAMDEMEDHDIYKKILGSVIKTNDELSKKQQSIIAKYTEEKEMFQKVKRMIKQQLEKEGKTFVEQKKQAAPIIMAPPQNQQTTPQKPQQPETFKL